METKLTPERGARLNQLAELLKARGVVDVKLFRDPNETDVNVFADDTIRVLEAIIAGNTRPAGPLGDSTYGLNEAGKHLERINEIKRRVKVLKEWYPSYDDSILLHLNENTSEIRLNFIVGTLNYLESLHIPKNQ